MNMGTDNAKDLIVTVIVQEIEKVRMFAYKHATLTESEWDACLAGALMILKGKGEEKDGKTDDTRRD